MADELAKKISELDNLPNGDMEGFYTIGSKDNAQGNPVSYKMNLVVLKNAIAAAAAAVANANAAVSAAQAAQAVFLDAIVQQTGQNTAKVMSQKAVTDALAAMSNTITTLTGRIGDIRDIIPSAASASNQLADKAFVNSSIATATAEFRGTYDSLAELQAVSADDNDYGYVRTTDAAGNTVFKRYKYASGSWVFEYDLNNSSFTASQWAAINSAITAELVEKLRALPTNATLTELLNGKQGVIADLDTIRANATAGGTAYQKPAGGIPKSDMSPEVQSSLGKADSAVQESAIADNLTTNDPKKVLSAKQGKVLSEQVTQLDQELEELDMLVSMGSRAISYVDNEYVNNTNGVFVKYNGWSRTNYLDVNGLSTLDFNNPGASSIYNAFYDEGRRFIGSFSTPSNYSGSVSVPENASWAVFSNASSDLRQLTISNLPVRMGLGELSENVIAINDEITQLGQKVDELSDSFIKKDISEVTFQSTGTKTITGLSIPANMPFKIRVDSQFVYTRLDVFKGTTTLTGNRLVQSAVSGREYVVLSTTEVNAITLYLRTSSNFGEMTLNVEYDGVIKQSIAIQNNITAESYLVKKFLEEFNLSDYIAVELNEYTTVGNNLTYAISADIKFRNNITYNVFAMANTLGFFRFMYSNVNIEGVGFFEIPVYISDASKITSIYCGLTNPDNTLTLQANDALHNGWNMMRFATAQVNRSSYSTNYTTLNELRLYVETTEDTTIIVSIPSSITPPKAQIIFVDDHGYHDFMTTAYPDLKALGVPVTWAIQPGRLGVSVPGAGTLLTASDIEALSKDANSEFSWHTYDSSQEQQMSAQDLRDMFQSAITALRELNILPQYFWRAAWKQNDAINAMSCANLAEAFATWKGSYGCESIPFSDRYNIKRQEIHGKSETIISNMFRQLKCTHGLYVLYTHSIVQTMETGLEIHITQAEWDIFINYLTTAINEGWLEGTTFNSLRVKYGDAIL